MSDEEKEAVEVIKSDLAFCKSLRKRYRDEQQEKYYEIIINLIEKQSKEIEELKEKNKILEKLLQVLQGNLFESYKYYKDLASSYQANSVSKDKIKAKIEEVKDGTFDAKIVLQSLLEKE